MSTLLSTFKGYLRVVFGGAGEFRSCGILIALGSTLLFISSAARAQQGQKQDEQLSAMIPVTSLTAELTHTSEKLKEAWANVGARTALWMEAAEAAKNYDSDPCDETLKRLVDARIRMLDEKIPMLNEVEHWAKKTLESNANMKEVLSQQIQLAKKQAEDEYRAFDRGKQQLSDLADLLIEFQNFIDQENAILHAAIDDHSPQHDPHPDDDAEYAELLDEFQEICRARLSEQTSHRRDQMPAIEARIRALFAQRVALANQAIAVRRAFHRAQSDRRGLISILQSDMFALEVVNLQANTQRINDATQFDFSVDWSEIVPQTGAFDFMRPTSDGIARPNTNPDRALTEEMRKEAQQDVFNLKGG